MPRRETQLANQEFYHIIKKGVGKIFLDEEDRLRFVNSLLVCNDKDPVPWASRAFWDKRSPYFLTKTDCTPKKPLVEIHAFTLMSNHFHLLVRQLIEKGIQILMQKLGGYSRYFNKKYGREGTLFQAPYKVIHISTEEQLKNTFVYIHTNPVALVESGWKGWKVKNPSRAIGFLEKKYRWSSYWDYLGKKNFPQVTKRDFFLELFGGKKGIREEIESWIEFKNEIFRDGKKLQGIILE